MARCPERSPFGEFCELPYGHDGAHQAKVDFGFDTPGEASWPDDAEPPERRLERQVRALATLLRAEGFVWTELLTETVERYAAGEFGMLEERDVDRLLIEGEAPGGG